MARPGHGQPVPAPVLDPAVLPPLDRFLRSGLVRHQGGLVRLERPLPLLEHGRGQGPPPGEPGGAGGRDRAGVRPLRAVILPVRQRQRHLSFPPAGAPGRAVAPHAGAGGRLPSDHRHQVSAAGVAGGPSEGSGHHRRIAGTERGAGALRGRVPPGDQRRAGAAGGPVALPAGRSVRTDGVRAARSRGAYHRRPEAGLPSLPRRGAPGRGQRVLGTGVRPAACPLWPLRKPVRQPRSRRVSAAWPVRGAGCEWNPEPGARDRGSGGRAVHGRLRLATGVSDPGCAALARRQAAGGRLPGPERPAGTPQRPGRRSRGRQPALLDRQARWLGAAAEAAAETGAQLGSVPDVPGQLADPGRGGRDPPRPHHLRLVLDPRLVDRGHRLYRRGRRRAGRAPAGDPLPHRVPPRRRPPRSGVAVRVLRR